MASEDSQSERIWSSWSSDLRRLPPLFMGLRIRMIVRRPSGVQCAPELMSSVTRRKIARSCAFAPLRGNLSKNGNTISLSSAGLVTSKYTTPSPRSRTVPHRNTARSRSGAVRPTCDTLNETPARHGSLRSRSRRMGTLKLPSPSTKPATQCPRSGGTPSIQSD